MTELIYCRSGQGSGHIVRAERKRASDGAAILHNAESMTLCGKPAIAVNPFVSASSVMRAGGCCECVNLWYDRDDR